MNLSQRITRAMLSPIVTAGLIACMELGGPTTAPQSVTATEGTLENGVSLQWDAVAVAGVYIVYKADSEEGDYVYLASTDQTEYVDTAVEPWVHYWYRVAAADYLGSPESERLSAPVEGWSIHTYAWSGNTAAFGAAQFSLTVDRSVTGVAYLAWTDEGESAVTVGRYEDGGWGQVADPFGIADGDTTGSVAVAVSAGVPYVAYRDRSAAGGGLLTAVKLVEGTEEDTWEVLGSGAEGTAAVRNLSCTVVGGELYVAALDDSTHGAAPAPILVYKYTNGGAWEIISPGASGSNPVLIDNGASAVLAYEIDGPPSDIELITYNSGWTSIPDSATVAGDIPDGYLDFAYDYTTETYALAYLDDDTGTLKVFTTDGTTWDDISPILSADPFLGSIGVAADQGAIYLFYRDTASSRGTVSRYSGSDGGGWAVLPQDEDREGITGQLGLSHLSIEGHDGTIFAAARENTNVTADIYE